MNLSMYYPFWNKKLQHLKSLKLRLIESENFIFYKLNIKNVTCHTAHLFIVTFQQFMSEYALSVKSCPL